MFGFVRKKDINEKYKECRRNHGILLDVRTKEEYEEGHLPGAVNLPLDQINAIERKYPDQDRHYYVYCRSGMRARQAVSIMQSLGYAGRENIGGIMDYTGEIEK